MMYGIDGVIAGKLFGNGEGGSSGGGITLPELTNPAGADQILEGYEAVDGSGNKLTGTHVCESGGGGSDYWVLTDENGEIWVGEEVSSGSSGFEGSGVKPTAMFSSALDIVVYRVTIDGVPYVCSAASSLKNVTAGGLVSFNWSNKNGNYTVNFTDGLSHTLSVESWVPQLAQTAS